MTALATFAGMTPAKTVDHARQICDVARETFDAGATGLAGMREAMTRIEVALAGWNASAGAAVVQASRLATEKEIGGALLVLVQGFPSADKDRVTAFGRLLVEDVVELGPSIGALAAGTAHLRKTSKFLLSIAEVLDAIKAAEDPLRAAPVRVDELKKRRDELAAQIAEAERRATARTRVVTNGE